MCAKSHVDFTVFHYVHMYIASVTLKKYVFCEGKPNYLGGPGQQANCEPVCLLFYVIPGGRGGDNTAASLAI